MKGDASNDNSGYAGSAGDCDFLIFSVELFKSVDNEGFSGSCGACKKYVFPFEDGFVSDILKWSKSLRHFKFFYGKTEHFIFRNMS